MNLHSSMGYYADTISNIWQNTLFRIWNKEEPFNSENVILGGMGEIEIDGINIGYTIDGLTITYERVNHELFADQSTCLLDVKRTDTIMTLSTTVLEATLNALQILWGIVNPAIDGFIGTTFYSQLGFGCDRVCDEPEHSFWFSGLGINCKTRYIEIYKVFSYEVGEHSYTKDGVAKIPITFKAIADRTKPKNEQYGKIIDTDEIWEG